jgi:hypothetical protein
MITSPLLGQSTLDPFAPVAILSFFYSFGLRKFMDLIVGLGNQFIAEPFSDIHKKGSIKERPF